ncbi:unnamed protein product [Aureobasidium mustum]|uniref:Uncharacterized protein n=1 Tax=Aureobasidium mustum TaxID=2773714 RepID=A0A9N8JPZ3_9PEZI|nr:unnamed protein product [Aureobasidium mustum]
MTAKEGPRPPYQLFFFNLVAVAYFGPRLYTYLQLRPSFSLTLHCITTACLLSTVAFIVIDTSFDIMRLLYKLLGFLLRRMLDYHLEDTLATQWRFPASEQARYWIKLLLEVVIGVSATIYIIKIKAGGWEAAKRNIAARYNEKTKPDLGTAERGGVPKEANHEPVLMWAGWAFLYSDALFESSDWFVTVLGGKSVEESSRGKWRFVCMLASMVVAGAVALARRRWITKARRLPVEKEHVVEGRSKCVREAISLDMR